MQRIRLVNAAHLLTGTTPPESVSIEELAQRARRSDYQARKFAHDLGLTPRTLERRFRRLFGTAPGQWLAQQRMLEARDLLERGFTPKQTAAEICFAAPSLFRKFRRSFGCTPGQYQKQRAQIPDGIPFLSSESDNVSHSVTVLSQLVTPSVSQSSPSC